MYKTNIIKGYNRQLKKVIKNKKIFPKDKASLKILYFEAIDITKNGFDILLNSINLGANLNLFFRYLT
ncbi:hypothetical protein ACV3P8_16650 [Clostridium perfringens]